MSAPCGWWLRLRRGLRRHRFEADMAEEMRHHIELDTARRIALGEDPAEARRLAAAEFGSVDARTEEVRDARLGAWCEQRWREVRFAARSLRLSPGFSAIAVISLALGMGAGTGVFSVANAILLRSLPVPDPHQLRVLHWAGDDLRINSLSGGDTAFTPPHFFELRDQAAPLADVFGFIPLGEAVLRGRHESFAARGEIVSDNFFSALRVRPTLGRPLQPGADFSGTGNVVVLSHACWESRYTKDQNAIGQTLAINGEPFTIVGVAPAGFAGVEAGQTTDFYVPLSTDSPFLYRKITSNFHWYVRIMARLKPGVDEAQLGAALNVAWSRMAANFMQQPRIRLSSGDGGEASNREAYRRPLLLLLSVVALVMLVACANLAGLTLARGAAREHERSVRAALGASRGRLIRESMVESVLLALAGGAGGMLIAGWLRRGIGHLLAGPLGQLDFDFATDRRVLGFSCLLVLLAAILSGLVPALRAGRVDPIEGLKNRGSTGAISSRLGKILVATQIGLSLLLLTGAGLYVRTLANIAAIDPGFSTENLLLFRLNISGSPGANADPAPYFGRLQDALAQLPGVQEASLVEFPLLSGLSSGGGEMDGKAINPRRLSVGETFFSTMGITLPRGRALEPGDSETAPKVVVVNEAFVAAYSPDRDPIGRSVHVWDADWQIVGVSRNVKYNDIRTAEPPTVYFPFRQRFYGRFKTTHLHTPYFTLRTTLPPLALAPAVRQLVGRLDPDVTLTRFTTQEDVRRTNIGRERLFAILCGALGGLALLLACIGIYGLIAYDVTRRTREIAIRMAIGAQPGDVVRPIVRQGMILATIGISLGIPMALGLARLVENQLYDVVPYDPLTLMTVSLGLFMVAIAATLLPAVRAARITPLVALQNS